MTMKPPPPGPATNGTVTPSALAVATAASTALPPRLSTSMPARLALASIEATEPPLPAAIGCVAGTAAARAAAVPVASAPASAATRVIREARERRRSNMDRWLAVRPAAQTSADDRPSGGAQIHAVIVAEQRQLVAHLGEPRDRPRGDLLAELIAVHDVRGDEHRALLLIARVDDRVELLQHPVGGALGADVVDVEQVDRGEPVEQVDMGALGPVGVADLVEQARERVDGDRVAAFERRLGDEHRERRLAGAGRSHQPQAAAGGQVIVDAGGVLTHRADDPGVDVAHRRAVERDVAVPARDHGRQAARLRPGAAVTGGVRLHVVDEARAVADPELAGAHWNRSPA